MLNNGYMIIFETIKIKYIDINFNAILWLKNNNSNPNIGKIIKYNSNL